MRVIRAGDCIGDALAAAESEAAAAFGNGSLFIEK